jgi:hypothetical protein
MKIIIIIIIIATILSILTVGGDAQTLLIPGENVVEKKWIGNTAYQMTWYALKDTLRMEIGDLSTEIKTDKSSITVVTNVRIKSRNTPWVDSTIADINTLKPIHHSSYNSQRDMVLDFGKIVSGFYKDKVTNKNISISDTTTTDYFDSNLYPTLIGWLPLRQGYRQDISIYDYNPTGKIGVIKAYVKEVKTGTYQSSLSGLRDVWIVTVTDEIGNGENGISIYYLDKSNRKLWKQEINAGGRKMLMISKE